MLNNARRRIGDGLFGVSPEVERVGQHVFERFVETSVFKKKIVINIFFEIFYK